MDTDGEGWAKEKDDKHLPTSAHGIMAPPCNTEAKNGSNSGCLAGWLPGWVDDCVEE